MPVSLIEVIAGAGLAETHLRRINRLRQEGAVVRFNSSGCRRREFAGHPCNVGRIVAVIGFNVGVVVEPIVKINAARAYGLMVLSST